MILVTGATGNVGRRVVDELLGHGAKVRAASRTQTLPGVETVRRPVFDGGPALFLHPRTSDDPAALLAEAKRHGVKRVVVLSAMNVDEPLDQQPSRVMGDRNREAEDAAVASGLEWTSLRPSSFALNTARMWGDQIKAGDVVRYVYPTFEESWIDERDVAAVAAHALVHDDVVGRRLQLTGPQSLSHAQGVATVGAVLGRTLRFEEVDEMPGPFGASLMRRYADHLDRPHFPPTNDVAAVLRPPARTDAEWGGAPARPFPDAATA